MNGADVFNFVLREIPKNIKQTLNFAETSLENFDHYIFHQANKFMNDYLVKKLKLDKTKATQEQFLFTFSFTL